MAALEACFFHGFWLLRFDGSLTNLGCSTNLVLCRVLAALYRWFSQRPWLSGAVSANRELYVVRFPVLHSAVVGDEAAISQSPGPLRVLVSLLNGRAAFFARSLLSASFCFHVDTRRLLPCEPSDRTSVSQCKTK